MKNLFINTAATFILASALLTACKKGNDAVIPVDNGTDKMTKFFTKYQSKPESFVLNAGTGGVITTSKGTKVNFPAGIFTNNGQPVSGNVNITVLDVFKASDMILNNKPTITSNGEPLISFGEIRVDANQNGAALNLRKPDTGGGVMVQVPVGAGAAGQQREAPMWRGDEPPLVHDVVVNGNDHENQPTSITSQYYTYPGISWTQIPGFGIAGPTQTTFPLDSLGVWRNCDALMGDPRPKTTVLGYIGSHYNSNTGSNYSGNEPTSLFFKVKNTNTLIKIYTPILNPAAGKEGFLSYQNSIPIGIEGSFLAVSSKDGKFYAEMKDVTVGSPAPGKNFVGIQFTLQEVSESGLYSLIQQINSK